MLIYLDIGQVIIPVSPPISQKAAFRGFFISEKNQKLAFEFCGGIKKASTKCEAFCEIEAPFLRIMNEASNPILSANTLSRTL